MRRYIRREHGPGEYGACAKDLDLTRGANPYLGRLLYTRNEADAVMAVTPPDKGMLAVDFDASRAVATSPALAKPDRALCDARNH